MRNRVQPKLRYIPWRLSFLVFLISVVVLGLVFRVFQLSILDREFLRHEGDERSLRIINIPAFRGMIADRNGFPLAVSTPVYSAWMNPKAFDPDAKQLAHLAKQLQMPVNALSQLITKNKSKHREFTYLKRAITPENMAQVKELAIPGLFFQEDYKRYYPEGEVTAQLLGFTNIDDKGQEGLELAYNEWLSGQLGKKQVTKDRRGQVVADVQLIQEQKPGNNLTLSIDKRIQYLAYRELMQGVAENVASSGTVVVLDVQTGEVLAMVNNPSFNPNNRKGYSKEVFRNKAITDSFEPGSTLKAFSIASALDSGMYKPTSMVDTFPGWMRVDRHLVRDEHNNGTISVARIMQVSSNVGATKMVLSLPPHQLWQMLHKVGFGESTGTGFPGEQSGALVNRPIWSPFMLATLSFGYGMSATTLQLAQAYSVIANDGLKVPVSLVKVDHPVTGERILSPKIAKQMRDLLETVVSVKGATGQLARVPGYRIAGKTGTAVMVSAHGGYQKHHFTSSFIGMAPASHPRIVVAVIIHDPQGKHYYASMVSAPIFEKIMEGTLRTLNIAPDDIAPKEPQAV